MSQFHLKLFSKDEEYNEIEENRVETTNKCYNKRTGAYKKVIRFSGTFYDETR